jgi:hypothetical protein
MFIKGKAISFQEDTTVTALVATGTDIWMGTSHGCLFMIDMLVLNNILSPKLSLIMPQTRQIIKKIALQSTSSQSPSQTRGVKIISLGPNFLWVAIGAEIHFFSAKVLIVISYIFNN